MSAQKLSQREVDEFFRSRFRIGANGLVEERRTCAGYVSLAPRRSGTPSLEDLLAASSPMTIEQMWARFHELERAALD